jgi:hypothetical protein
MNGSPLYLLMLVLGIACGFVYWFREAKRVEIAFQIIGLATAMAAMMAYRQRRGRP